MTSHQSLLFVCLGNICRSPLAEGIFLHLAQRRGLADRFVVDSCGTGSWHVGSRPDPRAIATAAKHGVNLPGLARQFDASQDPDRFDLILAMDRTNASTLVSRGAHESQVRLVRAFDPTFSDDLDVQRSLTHGVDLDVPDPYYGADNGFDVVYEMLVRACDGLLDSLG